MGHDSKTPDDEKPWDVRIFELVPSGVDGTIIEENLKLTPTQRLEKMIAVLEFADEVRGRRANGH